MGTVILISLIGIVIYSIVLYFWKRFISWRLSKKASLIVKFLHYSLLLICLTLWILYEQFDLRLKEDFLKGLFVISFLISGISAKFILQKASMNKIENGYFNVFSYFPYYICFIQIFLPMMGTILVLDSFKRLSFQHKTQIYGDSKLVIYSTNYGALIPDRIQIVKDLGVLEKVVYQTDNLYLNLKQVNVKYDLDSIRITFSRHSDVDRIKQVSLPKIN